MYEEYIKGRNSYNYPAIGLFTNEILNDIGNWENVYKQHKFNTSLDLDIHHTSHLLSKNENDVLLGIYSVMYWGYITSGAKSITRCNWLSNGNARNKQLSLKYMGKSKAVDIIRKSESFLNNSRYSDALTEIRKLPHVGVSFGTKFLAFIDPENVGILDEKIIRHLASDSFNDILEKETIRDLNKPKNPSIRFQAFCEALNIIKTNLNKNGCQWSDLSGAKMNRFRAIDVERAFFAIAKQIDNKK